MRTGHLLFSAVQFLFVVAILCIGGCLIALPWAPHFRFKMAEFFFNRSDLFLPLGSILLGVGLILAVGFYFIYRRQYYQVKLSTVEMALLRSMVGVYWKKIFPDENLAADLIVGKDQKLELVMEVPSLLADEHEKLLEKVEKEVGSLLASQLGYKAEFLITIVMR